MKIPRIETLISRGAFAESDDWRKVRSAAIEAIGRVHWPPGSGAFTIYPQSGKKRGEGNGVKPIKDAAITWLVERHGWQKEHPWPVGERIRPGNMRA